MPTHRAGSGTYSVRHFHPGNASAASGGAVNVANAVFSMQHSRVDSQELLVVARRSAIPAVFEAAAPAVSATLRDRAFFRFVFGRVWSRINAVILALGALASTR